MERKKILFVINQFFKGGAESALLNLLRALSPEKYEVDLLIFDHIDLPDTISLIPEIPEWVHVVNVAEEERRLAFLKKVFFKIYRKITNTQLFRQSAVNYVRGHEYDVAISFGEWFSSALVAKEVQASRKYVWIHADLDKAAFLHPDIIRYYQWFDRFIFVSEQSRRAAVTRYPELKECSVVVYNLADRDTVLAQSMEEIDKSCLPMTCPTLLTVANVREEKNYLRQVRVMQELRKRGVRVRWLNIGSLANLEQTARLKKAIHEAGLDEDFLLLGAMKNPYPWMRAADAVCVLSDHESWSMVITEAKTLGVPVIATKTSGALAQILDTENGLLCDFSEEDITAQITRYLKDLKLQNTIRANLDKYSSRMETLKQLEPLLQEEEKKILYVFDNINYKSGARNAALYQIHVLQEKENVTLFSIEPCRDETLSKEYRITDLSGNLAFRSLSVPIREVLSNNNYGKRVKIIRVLYALLARMHLDHKLYDWLLNREVSAYMEGFDAVCVVSEASKLRNMVSQLKHPQKIQWIHTDYIAWSQQSGWTKAITSRDGILYQAYDHIVCLSERLRSRFAERYPHLEQKTMVVPNLIDYEKILRLSQEPSPVQVDSNVLNLITVGRMEQEKRHDRLLEIAAELKKHREFHWYFVGDGKLLGDTQRLCEELDLSQQITFTGAMENPYPLMKQCDLFVLLSDYEGTPVTIDEAKVLGLPVLANDVGGIADMLENEVYGTLITGEVENWEVVSFLCDCKEQRTGLRI